MPYTVDNQCLFFYLSLALLSAIQQLLLMVDLNSGLKPTATTRKGMQLFCNI